MKATQQLVDEHQAVKLMLSILGKVISGLEAGESVPFEHLDQIMSFIKVFLEKCHHKKEESLLFPAMQEVSIPGGATLIKDIIKEHFTLHEYVGSLDQAVRDYHHQDPKAALKIIDSAKKYIDLLSPHADKEDKVLFPLADQYLSQEKQEQLLNDFDKVETSQIGPGVHEKFHQMLEDLRKIYLEN